MLAIVFVLVVLLALLVGGFAAPAALAAAGGGSGGFGRGFGGGGFGGGGFGGRGFHAPLFFFAGRGGATIGAAVLGVIVVGALLVGLIVVTSSLRYRHKRHERVRKVELAAREAAEDDSEFDPETVHNEAAALFRNIEAAWTAGDRDRLATLAGPDLLREWNRRLDDFARRGWSNQVKVLSEPELEYVGLVHRGEARDDHVCVRIEALLHDIVVDRYGRAMARNDSVTAQTRMCEYWTLGKRDGHWILMSIEQRREGDHNLDEAIVATPWADVERLRDSALVEQAVAESLPEGASVSDIAPVELSADARAAALDIALADGRFAPDVLTAEVHRAVEAWAQAVDGDQRDLLELAAPEAVSQLLHPGDTLAKTRLVVRGPQVRSVRIVALEPHAEPPTMTVDLEINGRRYIEDRDTTVVVAGSKDQAVTFAERWTLALSGSHAHPWQIVDTATPTGHGVAG